MNNVLVNTAINVKRDLFMRGRDSSTRQLPSAYMTTRKSQKRPMYVRERLIYIRDNCPRLIYIRDNVYIYESWAVVTYSYIYVTTCIWVFRGATKYVTTAQDSYIYNCHERLIHVTTATKDSYTWQVYIWQQEKVKRDLCTWGKDSYIHVTTATCVYDHTSMSKETYARIT